MKKIILLTTVAIMGCAGMASAADLRVPVAPPAAYAPVFSWTGCYIGAYLGGGWNGEDVNVRDVNGYSRLGGWDYDLDSSFIGGGTLGCNWQPVGSPIVIGLEGELGYLDIEGDGFDPFRGNHAVDPPGVRSSTKIGDWYGMITGRLGYSWDRALAYLKGGVAFVDIESSISDPWGVNISATKDDSVAAWTLGGGLEWAFDPNWSIKAEYMYIGIDEDRNVCGVASNGGSFCWNHDVSGVHTAKVGLNYRFGIGAPLVARY